MDKISALMDGELDAHQSAAQYARLKYDLPARECWDTFHLIGDAMRGEHGVAAGLAASVSERLAREPVILAPQRRPERRVNAYAWSAAASLSAVALVGWVGLNLMPRGTEVAEVPAARPTPVAQQLANLPSDGRMNEYLLAHQEYSPSTAIQGVVPYIRTVSATHAKGRE